jgi:hypothetical protein
MQHAEKCPVCNGEGKHKGEKCRGCFGSGWVTVGQPDVQYVPYYPTYPAYPISPTNPWRYPYWVVTCGGGGTYQ